ncbi:MAG: hypothetical protein NDI62_00670 [Burkholderiales bacterium]|nr:hypothetical protein [Burkholderiales bacterium]
MELVGNEQNIQDKNIHKNKVHKVLAHSYLSFFLLFLVGMFLDFIFPLKIFNGSNLMFIGVVLLICGTFLIFWAQRSSLKLQKENMTKDVFYRGPYRYTRSPTHYGLFFLMLGFGFTANALFMVLFSVFSFFITKFVFIKKQEKILEEKYGSPYIEYKKLVRF